MLAEGIARGVNPMEIDITPDEVSNCRKKLRQIISTEKALYDKNRKIKEKKQASIKQMNNNNRKQITNHKSRNDNVCGRWINRKCRKGEDCTFEHPIMCESDIYRKACGSEENPCDLYHPQVCSTNSRGKVCPWGEECRFRHLLDDVQGHGHENNRHRQDSHSHENNRHRQDSHSHENNRHRQGGHYKHYDDHYDRYGDQNNYGYGDGRHQNKRALHNQNIHKNYNINNEYGGRVDSHQGLQSHHSRENRNQGANNRQGPQINSSGQNVGFLGCQRNPIDWPPLTEEKLLKTLQELIRAELSNWGPTRR